MNNYIDIIYTYFIFNILLALGYMVTRGILAFANRHLQLGEQQKLRIVKFSFVLLLVALVVLPYLFPHLLNPETSTFQIQPFLKNSATSLLTIEMNNEHPYTFPKLDISLKNLLPVVLIFSALIVGIIYAGVRYNRHIQQLRKFIAKSYSYKSIGKIKIVISDQIKVPFCWSWLNKSYICLPYSCLDEASLLKTFTAHEIQHIRQKDPLWQHLLAFVNIICFWNPALINWKVFITHLQEYACDEALVVDKKISPIEYTKALLISAESALDGKEHSFNQWGVIHFLGKKNISILKTRIEKMFDYTKTGKGTSKFFALVMVLLFSFSTLSYAFSTDNPTKALTKNQLQIIIEEKNLDKIINLQANENILQAMNDILSSPKAKDFIKNGLKNFPKYQDTVQPILEKNHLPLFLLALPLAESGYMNLSENAQTTTAGLWQFIPPTASAFGLVVNANRDDRLDPSLSTQAACNYLNMLHKKFGNWQLALAAYHLGEQNLQPLIDKHNTTNIWEIIQKENISELNRYLSIVDATIVIMAYPQLL